VGFRFRQSINRHLRGHCAPGTPPPRVSGTAPGGSWRGAQVASGTRCRAPKRPRGGAPVVVTTGQTPRSPRVRTSTVARRETVRKPWHLANRAPRAQFTLGQVVCMQSDLSGDQSCRGDAACSLSVQGARPRSREAGRRTQLWTWKSSPSTVLMHQKSWASSGCVM